MAQSEEASQYSEAQWEDRKDTIRRLYLIKDLSLQSVRERLEEDGFVARLSFSSKFQYETYLKKWGFRKNLKKTEWKIVAAAIAQRKVQDKDSEVCVDGIPMKSWKVKKAISRYGVSGKISALQGSSLRLPAGITIRMSSRGHSAESSPRKTTSPPTSPLISHSPVYLPRDTCLTPARLIASVQTCVDPMRFPSIPMTLGTISPELSFLPIVQFKEMILNIEVNATMAGLENVVSTGIVGLANNKMTVSSQLRALFERSPSNGSDPELEALLPENMPTENVSSLQIAPLPKSSPASKLLELTLFVITNQLYILDSTAFRKLYKWIKRQSDAQFLDYILSIGGPTVEVLAEQLLVLSIENEDHRTVRKILSSCRSFLNLDEISYAGILDYKRTPLQRACELRNKKLIESLLIAGTNVNFPPYPSSSPLYLLIDDMDDDFQRTHVDIDLVQLLLDNNANVNPSNESPLSVAAETGQLDLVALLLSKGADPNFEDDSGTPLLNAVGSEATMKDKIQISRLLIDHGANVRKLIFAWDELCSVLDLAAEHSSVELVELLIEAGAPFTDATLRNAVNNGNLGVVETLIKSGGRVTEREIKVAAKQTDGAVFELLLAHAPASQRDFLRQTGFTEAISHGNKTITATLLSLDAPLYIYSHREMEVTKALQAAANRGDIELFHTLLGQESVYRESTLQNLGKLLSGSIAGGHSDLTNLLLAEARDVHEFSGDCRTTPLLEAMRRKDVELSNRLLSTGASVNMAIRKDEGVFHTSVLPSAVAWGYYPLIQECISLGADINALDGKGEKTALGIAIEKGDRRSFQLLIDWGADVNQPCDKWNINTPLVIAIRNNDTTTISELLELGADPNEMSLAYAVSRSETLVATILRCKIDKYKRCPQGFGSLGMQVAIALSKPSIVKAMLTSGVDPNFLVECHRHRFTTDVFYLKLQGRYESALATNLRLGKDTMIFEMLLKHGADVNRVCDSGGNTALIMAINEMDLKSVKLLLASGADLDPKLHWRGSRNPLQKAVEVGSMKIVHELLNRGADVNADPCPLNGATALQLAAIKGFLGIACLLIEKGAIIDAPPAKNGGRTAIEGASEYGRIDMVQLLIDNGAQLIGTGSKQYERARQYASKNRHGATKRLLERCQSQQTQYQELLRDYSMDPEGFDRMDTDGVSMPG